MSNVKTDSNVNTVGNNQITYYNLHHSGDEDPYGDINNKLSYVSFPTSSIVNLAPGEMPPIPSDLRIEKLN
jgi:hypothetical protein